MQRSLVYNAIKPCSRCKETLFATQTNLHRIHLLPIHNFATEAVANHSSHSICKDTTFHHPFASFPPTFSAHHHASDALRVYFGCTSITKYTRRTASQLPHTQPKTAPRHPKGVLVYFLNKSRKKYSCNHYSFLLKVALNAILQYSILSLHIIVYILKCYFVV